MLRWAEAALPCHGNMFLRRRGAGWQRNAIKGAIDPFKFAERAIVLEGPAAEDAEQRSNGATALSQPPPTPVPGARA